MLAARILCKPEDAISFGETLLSEINLVEKERAELGIPDYDDTYYAEEWRFVEK